MSAVKQALAKLNNVVGSLEKSLDHLEIQRAGEQRDMFSRPAINGNAAGFNAKIVAQKLDNAIEGLEGVLQEGRG